MTRPGERPVTLGLARYAYSGRLLDAQARFEQLDRQATANTLAAWLRRRGEFDAANPDHRAVADVPLLTKDEQLEHMATGALLADHYANDDFLHNAVEAGASWEEIAMARGNKTAAVQGEYRGWIEAQRKVHEATFGGFGFDYDTYAVASAQIPDGMGPRELCVHADTGATHWLQSDEACPGEEPPELAADREEDAADQDREAG